MRGTSWVHRKFETHLVELGAAATIPKIGGLEFRACQGWQDAHPVERRASLDQLVEGLAGNGSVIQITPQMSVS